MFRGTFYSRIIDKSGRTYFIHPNSPDKAPAKYNFQYPAAELVCCKSYKAVLLNNFKLYGNGELNRNWDYFAPVASLAGQNIIKTSGYLNSYLALRNNGLVFSYGENNQGQLGNISVESFRSKFYVVKISSDEKIIYIACSSHTLLISESGKLFGCGWNGLDRFLLKSKIDSNSN